MIFLPLAVAASMTQASTSGYKGYDRSFCVRMKSTLTKRGCHFKSSGYRVSDNIFNGTKNMYLFLIESLFVVFVHISCLTLTCVIFDLTKYLGTL